MFEKPLRATKHCRHYSYELGLNGRGPQCAVECDLSDPKSTNECMPDVAKSLCSKREEYTQQEREEWQDWLESESERHSVRMTSIDQPIPTNSQIKFDCACKAGTVAAARGRKRAYINCSCDLGELQINIGHEKAWPKQTHE